MATTEANVHPGPAARPRRPVRAYLPIAALALAMAISGFWSTYFGPLLTGTVQAIPMIHVHAAVFVGWLLLVGAQAYLAATGRMRLHRRVGEVGMYWGLLVIVVGTTTAFVVFDQRVDAGDLQRAQVGLFVPLTDLMVFIPFFAAAWIWKSRPELHKRLIVVATTILLIAAVHRITFLGPRPRPPALLLAIWLAPIYIAMIFDWIRTRRVHLVYVLGIAAVLFLKFGRLGMARSETWKEIAGYFTALYAG
jgi:hypothetical protein